MPKSTDSQRYLTLLKLLTERRKALGLSQTTLADRLGRIQTFVSKYERGERRLDIIEFLDIANALNLDPGRIIRQLGTSHD